MNIYREVYQANKHHLEKSALEMRNNTSLERTFSYTQMFRIVDEFEVSLQKANIQTGDRIALIGESSPEWVMAYLAIQKISATAVLVDAAATSDEMLALLEHSDVRGIYTTPKISETLSAISDTPIFNLYCSGALFANWNTPSSPKVTIDGDAAISSIIFSSGTTKKAAGIMHSHEGLILSARGCMTSNALVENDRFLAILPNSHIYGVICQIVGPLLTGGTTCFLSSLSADALVSSFQNFKPTIFPAVPKICDLLKTKIVQKIQSDPKTKSMFKLAFPLCLSLRKKFGINLGIKLFKSIHQGFGGELRILCSAGAPMSDETASFYYGTGFDVLITYGATETGIPTIGNRGKNITTDSCGMPYPQIEVKIDDNGELLVKSPFQMLGYFKDPEATLAAYTEDHWFRSGDLGQLDSKGNVCICGRCKDNIVLATGKKVAPDDIEVAYAEISGITELVVCGIPVAIDSYDEVHAFVVAEEANKAGILEALKERSAGLSQSMRLNAIHFLEEIPKTALQKPKRYLLRNMLLQAPVAEEITMKAMQKETTFEDIVAQAILRVSHANPEDLLPETRIFLELAIDSLSSMELACEIEDRCNVRVDHFLHKTLTFEELVYFVNNPTAPEFSPTGASLMPQLKGQFDYSIFRFARNLLCGIYRIRVNNQGALPENTGYIICANHVSYFDYLYIAKDFRKERFSKFCCMAKKELVSGGFWSKRLSRIAGMVAVERGDSVHGSMAALRDRLKEHWGVLIYPEGTRTKDGSMGSFKKGAALLAVEADVPIVPAYIRGAYEVYPRGKKVPNFFNWKQFKKYQVDVIYGDPISPQGLTPEELTLRIEDSIKRLES